MLGPPLDVKLHPLLLQAFLKRQDELADVRFPFLSPRLELARDILVFPGVQVLECEVLELPLDLRQPEPVGERRVNIECLLREAHLALRRQILECPHIVKPVGKFEEHHTNVVDHRQKHLAVAFRLGHLVAAEDIRNLRSAVDDVGDDRSKFLPDILYFVLGIFGDIVEKGCCNGNVVQGDFFGDNHRHFIGMVEKGIAGRSNVVLVGFQAEFESPPDQIFIDGPKILPADKKEIFQFLFVDTISHEAPPSADSGIGGVSSFNCSTCSTTNILSSGMNVN